MKSNKKSSGFKTLHATILILLGLSISGYAQINFQPAPSFFRTPRELPIIAIATSQTIRVEDYGATTNDSSDDTVAIANALKFAQDNSTLSNPIEIVFQEGIYNVSGISGDSHTFTITGANNIVINGNNAEILLGNPTVGFLKVAASENIIVKNLTIDYSKLPFTQGKVVEVNKPENFFLLEIDEGFPMINEAHLKDAPETWGMLKNAQGNIKAGAPNLFSPRNKPFQFIRTRTFKYNLSGSDINHVEVGDSFVYLGRYNARTIFNTTNSKQVTFMGITSYSSPAGTYNAFGSRELNILKCKIMIKPNSGRLHSGNADGIHISGGFTEPWVQGCEFSGYSDDAMNLKHTRREIKSVVSPTEIVFSAEVKVGDILQFFNPRDGLPIGTATVNATQKLSASEFKATLSSAVNITVISEHQRGDKCYVDTRSNESFVIRNNVFKNARRYGLLLQSTYGIIENNLFENLSTGGIVIKNGVDFGEGFAVNQIKIDGNTFKNCGYDKTYLDDSKSAAINIGINKLGTPCNESNTWCGELPSTWQGHKNITISNNTISYNKKGLNIENVDTALIQSNDISPNPSFSGTDLGIFSLNNNSNITLIKYIYVKSSGSNATGNGSSTNPYATISFAISQATSGDTIFVDGLVKETSQISITGINLTFQGINNAIIERDGLGRISNVDGTTVLIFKNITFQNANAAVQGTVLNTTSNNANLTFEDCLFQNNIGTVQNGNVIHIGNADATFIRCTFYNNTATATNGRGAAIIFGGSFTGTITNCTFYQNKLTANPNNVGAAIVTFTDANNPQQLTITNSLFANNTDSEGESLDILCAATSNLTMVNSLAQKITQPTTFVNTNSKITADFTNTTFTFVSPNVTFSAPNSLSDDTPIDFGNDTNDAGSWDSKINIFKGTSSLTWTFNGNWSSGVAPSGDTDENIAILIGKVCNLFDEVSINNIKVTSELRIQNNRVLIVKGESTVTGIVRYFRDLQSDVSNTKAWHLVSSPLSGEIFDTAFADKNDIAVGTGSNRGIAKYNPGQTGSAAWTYFTWSDMPATPGRGYSMKITPDGITFVDGGGEYEDNAVGFEGDFNTNNDGVDVTISQTGFNLLGNPYTAFINSATFLGAATNTIIDQSQIWLWNQATEMYEVKMSGEPFILAPAQGFFVKANSTGTLNFAEANQSRTGDLFQKSSKTALKLAMTDGINNRFAKVYYLDNATTGYDLGWEGEIFGGIKNELDIYTNLLADNQGKKYQIQSLPISEMENMVIPVGINASKGKEITFSLDAMNFPSDLKVFIEDRQINTFNEISDNKIYKVFLENAMTDTGRFYLHTSKSVLSTRDFELETISIYKTENNNLKMVGLPSGNTSFILYNILGKKLVETSFISNGTKEISLPNLSNGIYLINLETSTGKINKKIVL